MTRITPWLMGLALAVAGGPTVAEAQTRPAPSGNPLQALPQIRTPRKAPNISVQVRRPNPTLAQLLATHLTPKKVQIEGVKSIPFAEVAARFTPLVGKDITVAQLLAATNGVTKLYQQRGYALSFAFVPAQTFDGGIVRITVVEGYVGDVKITGKAGPSEAKIRAIAEHIRRERPLRRATFERYVNTLGMLPGLTISATVPPPRTTSGATTLELNVDRRPLNAGAGLDLHHPGVQGLFSVTENGLASLGEQLSLSALAPRGRDRQSYVAANAAVPVGTQGIVAHLDASHYRGHPVDNPGLPAYVERTVVNEKLGLSVTVPLYLRDVRKLTGTIAGYASHDENSYHNTINGARIGLRSQVRVLQAQLDYMETHPHQTRRASVTLAKAFNVFGASKAGETNVPGVTETNPVSLEFVRTAASFSQTNEWPLKIGTAVSLTGQYSPDTLPTSEQIAFGAQRFALGYEPGEASGDSGWAASFEVNRPFSIRLPYLQTLTPYVSFDTARVYLHTGAPAPSRLASVAIGLRLTDTKHYSVDLSLAKAVADAPLESPSRSPRLNATFSYQLF